MWKLEILAKLLKKLILNINKNIKKIKIKFNQLKINKILKIWKKLKKNEGFSKGFWKISGDLFGGRIFAYEWSGDNTNFPNLPFDLKLNRQELLHDPAVGEHMVWDLRSEWGLSFGQGHGPCQAGWATRAAHQEQFYVFVEFWTFRLGPPQM